MALWAIGFFLFIFGSVLPREMELIGYYIVIPSLFFILVRWVVVEKKQEKNTKIIRTNKIMIGTKNVYSSSHKTK